MAAVTDAPRKLLVRSHLHEADQVIVAVQDLGSGIDPDNADRLFNPFFTTDRFVASGPIGSHRPR
jgi:C4-dicarboxylate-specific signal transduction histidine kinase